MTVGAFGTGKVTDYSGVIDKINVKLNKVTNLGLFSGKGVSTSSVVLDVSETGISVRGTHERRGPAKGIKHGKTAQMAVIVPHIELEDYIFPEDVNERRKPGTDEQDVIANVRANRLEIMSKSLDLTHEYMRLSAIKGQTKDGAGNILFDAFTSMGKTLTSSKFDLEGGVDGLKSTLLGVKRHIENTGNSTGGMVEDIICLCGSTFYDSLINHPEMAEAYGNQVGLANPMRDDIRAGFVFQGIYFIEYSGSFTLENGTTEKAIADDEAWFFPRGVEDMLQEFYAPANRLDYVGTSGQLKYAFQYSDPEGKHLKLDASSDVLMVNTRPEMVYKLTDAA